MPGMNGTTVPAVNVGIETVQYAYPPGYVPGRTHRGGRYYAQPRRYYTTRRYYYSSPYYYRPYYRPGIYLRVF